MDLVNKMKYKEKMYYIKEKNDTSRLIRTEILFTPILIFAPLIVGILFILDWVTRGILEGDSGYVGTLILGIIIIVVNIIFDIPFLKSLREHGEFKKYHYLKIGTNSRLDEIQALILSVKFKHLNEWNRKRRLAASKYNSILSDISYYV